MLDTTKTISVLNYNENPVCIYTAPNKSVMIEKSEDDEPTVLPLTLDEIKYANNGNAFKAGILEFPEDIENEIYELLRIDTSKVLKLKDIKNILLNPTKDGLKKILEINSLMNFDRVRGQFVKLKNSGYSLTLDVAELVSKRSKELFNSQIKTSIIVGEPEVKETKEQKKISALEDQIAEMKKLLEQAMAMNTQKVSSVETVTASSENDTEIVTKTDDTEKVDETAVANSKETENASTVKRKPGRPKKSASGFN